MGEWLPSQASGEKLLQLQFQGGNVLEFAFPDGEYLPTGDFKLAALFGVAVPGAGPLGFPEFRIRLGGGLPRPAVVEMPETAVDEVTLWRPAKTKSGLPGSLPLPALPCRR